MHAEFLTTNDTKNGKRIKKAIRVDIIFSFLRGLRGLRGSRVCSYFAFGFAGLGLHEP
jgi:hypothetical protein